MGWRIGLIAGGILLFWFVANLLLGPSTSGVELNAPPAGNVETPPAPGQLPPCVTVHTYSARGWAGHELTRSDVWLTGCNNASGQLRIVPAPRCSAQSVFGPGTATCTATPSGSDLRVSVTFHYPGLLDQISGQPATSTFTINPSGDYSAP